MQVKEIMTESPVCCQPETLLPEVAKMMIDADCGALPVIDKQGKPIGVLTDRDVIVRAIAERKNPLELKAADIMSKVIFEISLDATVEECCKMMEDNQIRRVIVIDENGECCGIVAQADIALYATKQQTADVVREISKSN